MLKPKRIRGASGALLTDTYSKCISIIIKVAQVSANSLSTHKDREINRKRERFDISRSQQKWTKLRGLD